MTNKEAIEIFKDRISICEYLFTHTYTEEQIEEACNLAIKALEDRPTGGLRIKEIKVSRYYWECPFCGANYPQDRDHTFAPKYCSYCGAKMEVEE